MQTRHHQLRAAMLSTYMCEAVETDVPKKADGRLGSEARRDG